MVTRRFLIGRAAAGLVLGTGLIAGAAGARGLFNAKEKMPQAQGIAFATWTDEEPLYLFYPGDKIEIDVAGAPELSRTTAVGPDGRVTMPLIGGVMAAYRSVPQLQAEIGEKYRTVLRNPEVSVLPGDTVAMQVMVGGEVKNPGWVPMTGELDALQAVMAAGGPLHTAKMHEVVIIRRRRDGAAMRQIVDLQDPLSGHAAQMTALRRYDIVYVPRTSVAEAGVFVEQWINNLIPGAVLNYFTYKTFTN